MNDIQLQFDREMLIDSLITLAERYAFRFPEFTSQLVRLAGEIRNNHNQTAMNENDKLNLHGLQR